MFKMSSLHASPEALEPLGNSVNCRWSAWPRATHTPDFIHHTLWPPNSPHLNSVGYKVWSVMQKQVCHAPCKPSQATFIKCVGGCMWIRGLSIIS